MAELAEALAPFAGAGALPEPIGSEDVGTTPTLPALESEPRVPPSSPAAGAAPHRRMNRSAMILTASTLLVLAALWILASDARTSNATRVAVTRTVPRASPAPEPEPASKPALVSSAPTEASTPKAVQEVAVQSPLEAPRRLERPRAKVKPALNGATPIAQPVQPAPPEPPPATASSAPRDVIEVRRGERTIVFKRENPLQQ
jgi:hypothetical protein